MIAFKAPLKRVIVIIGAILISSELCILWQETVLTEIRVNNAHIKLNEARQHYMERTEAIIKAAKAKEQLSSGEIDTANWKTYRNDKCGYNIKYPEDWTIEFSGSGLIAQLTNVFLNGPDSSNVYEQVTIFCEKNESGKTLNDFRAPSGFVFEVKDYILDNVTSLERLVWSGDGATTQIIAFKGRYLYDISFYENQTSGPRTDKTAQLIGQILSTFKFIE